MWQALLGELPWLVIGVVVCDHQVLETSSEEVCLYEYDMTPDLVFSAGCKKAPQSPPCFCFTRNQRDGKTRSYGSRRCPRGYTRWLLTEKTYPETAGGKTEWWLWQTGAVLKAKGDQFFLDHKKGAHGGSGGSSPEPWLQNARDRHPRGVQSQAKHRRRTKEGRKVCRPRQTRSA